MRWYNALMSHGPKAAVCAALTAFVFAAGTVQAADAAEKTPPKLAVVNFPKCLENSKLGKQQQASFDALKNQLEGIFKEKEKALTELAAKLQDTDYVDGLTPEAENELKFKFRSLNQELVQMQQQFMQTLQQANVKILQMVQEEVAKAASDVAAAKQIDMVLNEEAAFHVKPALDISEAVILKMDDNFDKQPKAPVPALPDAAKKADSAGKK